jgi:hypothetical protein
MKYNQIKSNGVVKIAVIPITYPNSKTPASVESVFKDAITTIDLRNEYLYGDSVKYDWTLISNWLMMPLNAENFAWDHPTVQADGSRKSDGQAQILTESEQTFHIFSAAEKEININDFDFIWIMSNPLESKVRFSGYGRSKPVRTATTFYPSLNYYGYGYAVLGAEKAFNGGPIGNLAETMAHEMQHFHGMVQHAPGNGWGWFISSNPTWEAWLAGWRKDNEFACFDLAENWKTAEVKLSSMDLNSTGYKSAVIKISNSEALIVESRRKGPYMSNFPKGFAGITVTHLDTTKSGDRWDGNWSKEKEYYLYFLRNKANKYQIYQTRNNAIWDENIIGYEGDSFVYKNVEITLEKSGDYDTIRISKN